jgi:D-alanyl-D-alanine carboxypeptidase/D-alanyl-D-alanine-endopeptidase (penicillin-binding protein 4)
MNLESYRHFHHREVPMLRMLSVLLAAAILIGCTGTRLSTLDPAPPLRTLSVASSSLLKDKLDPLFADSLFPPANVGVKVVSLTKNRELYSLNERMLFNPASNQKLFTSAATLSILGREATFSTTVSADTTSGRIIITGGGDPILSTADLDSIARMCAASLPAGRSWDVCVNVRLFDSLYWGAGWTWDEEPEAYGMFLSPLILNNNTVTVSVTPATVAGVPPTVAVDPPTAYTPVANTAITVLDSITDPVRVSRNWMERSNTITVTGSMRLNSRSRKDVLSVWKPELYAGTVFSEMLRKNGVATTGRVLLDSTTAALPPVFVFEHRIDTVLTFMNKVSDNLAAETMLKSIGARKSGKPGSARDGIHFVNQFLATAGIDTNAIAIADGSGLSRYNLTSPTAVIGLLKHMYADSVNFPVYYHTLPIAGVDGTIGRRMQGTQASGNLRAKTGTLSGVTALSGYVRTLDGEWLAFSILMQHYPGSSRDYRAVQDAIGAVLAGLRKTE